MPRAKTEEKELERREKISRARKLRQGYSLCDETKLKISRALTGRHLAEDTKQKLALLSGHPQTPETRRKISETLQGRPVPDNERLKRSKGVKRAYVEGRLRGFNRPHSEEAKRKISQAKLGHSTSSETRAKISKSLKKKWSRDKEYRENWLRKISKSLHIRPNKPEQTLLIMLTKHFPEQWGYTGDGSLIIGGCVPDFANVNGKKKLIELFGDYWHRGEDPQDKIDHYKAFGYETLVIWEHDLNGEELLVRTLLQFGGGKYGGGEQE